MEESNVIKSITIHTCPHCSKTLYIESQFTPPVIGTLFTQAQMEDAKRDCVERVNTLSIDEEKKDAVLKWLNDKSTVFGPGEVENIINSLLKVE